MLLCARRTYGKDKIIRVTFGLIACEPELQFRLSSSQKALLLLVKYLNMGDFDYNDLLENAEGAFLKGNKSQERLKIPDPDIIYEGRVSIVRNFADIVDMINRDPKHVAKFLMKELGIGVSIDSRRLLINRKVSYEQVKEKISQYMDSYVRCYECRAPDTEIQRIGRVDVLVCKACGAQHPIRLVREAKTSELKPEEGKEYSVTVTEVGKSGEGRSHLGGYVIVVPGGKKGQTVKVRIKKVLGTTAFSEIIASK